MSEPLITLRAAADHAGVSYETIRMWCKNAGIGRQIGASRIWLIDQRKLDKHLEGRKK